MSEENKTNILPILIIILVIIGLYFSIMYKNNNSSSDENGFSKKAAKTLKLLNDGAEFEKSVHKVNLKDLKTNKDLAKLIARRTPVASVANFQQEYAIQVNFSSDEIEKYSYEEYKNDPTIRLKTGEILFINKFEEGCKKVNIKAPSQSSCIVVADINGVKTPNTMDDDRFKIIVDGNENKFHLVEKQPLTE